MKIQKGLEILAAQCGRFATDFEVPEAAGQWLEELRTQVVLSAADEPLRNALAELLTPLFTQFIEQADGVTRDLIASHLEALRQQRAEAEFEFEKQREAALEKERAFARENDKAKADLLELQKTHAALHARVARIESMLPQPAPKSAEPAEKA